MIRQRNQDAAQADAMPFLALMFGVSVVCQLGVSLTSKLIEALDIKLGKK